MTQSLRIQATPPTTRTVPATAVHHLHSDIGRLLRARDHEATYRTRPDAYPYTDYFVRTSQIPLKPKFAELPFHALE
jgi:hypothetical protein